MSLNLDNGIEEEEDTTVVDDQLWDCIKSLHHKQSRDDD